MQKNRIRRIVALGAGLILAIAALASCSGKKAEEKKAAEETAVTVFAVSTTTATRGELQDYLEFSGDVTAKTNIDILPDAAGKIAEVRVQIGEYVEKNQVIALVDSSRPGMNYEPSPVKAPISGTITAVNVVIGSMVSQQLSVAKVSKMDTLQIAMNVPERFVSKIRPRQSAYLRFDAFPGEVFPARITEISPVLDQTSRTMAVKLALVESDARIKAGMFARVKLITETKTNIVKIPQSAVVTRFGKDFVFVVRNGTDGKTAVEKKEVSAGIRVDDKIEILSGIAPDEEIVVRGQTLLEDASVINIVSKLDPLPVMESNK